MIQEVKARKLHCFMPNTLTALHRVRHSTTAVIETLKPWPKRCDAHSQHCNVLKILELSRPRSSMHMVFHGWQKVKFWISSESLFVFV